MIDSFISATLYKKQGIRCELEPEIRLGCELLAFITPEQPVMCSEFWLYHDTVWLCELYFDLLVRWMDLLKWFKLALDQPTGKYKLVNVILVSGDQVWYL